MELKRIVRGLGLVVVVNVTAVWVHAQTTIVRDGQPISTIVLPAKPAPNEKLAAEELQLHIEKMSGAKLPIISVGTEPTGVPIFIGDAAPDTGLAKIRERSSDEAALRVCVTDSAVSLTGNSDTGSLYAVYELLNQLGVRWLIPGEAGTDVLAIKTIVLKKQELVDAPAFRGRILQHIGGTWATRNRLGGFNAGAHGLGPKFDAKLRPDLFYEMNGKPTNQNKVSNPEVLRTVIAYWRKKLEANPKLDYINVGPNDGKGFGDDPWDAEDFDPILGSRATTDRYVKFFNLVLADLQKDYPNVGLAFYAYTLEMRPPVREAPNPLILPVLAPISLDRFHALNNPLSWEKQYLKSLIEGWHAKGVKMMFRGYLFNLADQGLPFSMIDIVKNDWPYYYDTGFIAMRVECIPDWGYHAPAHYLATQLFWNPHADADAILKEWFERMYGPAAAAMKEHFDLVEDAYIHADYFTGNTFDVPKILTPEIRAKMGATLARAEKLAGAGNKFADRVRLTRLAYDYGEANFKMMDAFSHGDFAEANSQHDFIVNKLAPAATGSDPPVIDEKTQVQKYLERFWGRSIVNGYARITNGREIVAHLPDEWRLFLDPSNSGEKLFLFKPELGTQSWLPIKTWSASASDQGLRHYRGAAWYRCKVAVPDKFAGRKFRVWFGGIDGEPSVWINGQPLTSISRGASPIGLPFEFDAGAAVVAGKDNTVVVKVNFTSLHEVGTFGITGPAMIWAEQAGHDGTNARNH